MIYHKCYRRDVEECNAWLQYVFQYLVSDWLLWNKDSKSIHFHIWTRLVKETLPAAHMSG